MESSSSNEDGITLVLNPKNNISREENYRPVFLMNTERKLKILAN